MHTRLVAVGGVGIRVRRLGGNRAGEIRLTRFLRNEAVTTEEMVETAGLRTAGCCVGRQVLAIQDTTVVRSKGGGGLYLHPVLAVDAEDGAILGLVHAEFMSRDKGLKETRRERPVSEKESQRWLDGADKAAEVCAGAAGVTVIADRESDIFSAFALRPDGVELLVRAAQDRCLEDGGRLFGVVDGLPVAGQAGLDLPAKPGRKARGTQVGVRFLSVELARPRNGVTAGLPKSVSMTIVDVRELDPVPGEKVHWRLLTTHPVNNVAEAFAVVELYRRRWAIEQLFRTMKTQGFDIEGLLIEEEPPLRRLVMATLIAATTIQQLWCMPGTAARAWRRRGRCRMPSSRKMRPCLRRFVTNSRARPSGRRTPIPRTLWPMRHGSVPVLADGPATMENQDPLSSSTAGSTSKTPNTASPPSTLTTMCESGSPTRGRETRGTFSDGPISTYDAFHCSLPLVVRARDIEDRCAQTSRTVLHFAVSIASVLGLRMKLGRSGRWRWGLP